MVTLRLDDFKNFDDIFYTSGEYWTTILVKLRNCAFLNRVLF